MPTSSLALWRLIRRCSVNHLKANVRSRHGLLASVAATTKVIQHLLPLLNQDIVLCTDGHLTFEAFTGKHHFEHKVLNASAGERVKEKAFHIQGVNNYHQRLKGWLRRFNGVATKYLPHYLGWFRWFDQQTSEISQPSDFMSDFISSEANEHLMRT